MTTTDPLRAQRQADQFGRAVAMRLSGATDELPYEVRERLRAARTRALQARREAVERAAPVVVGRASRGGSATLGFGDKPSLFTRIASVLPILLLAGGLVLIHTFQTERRASELAEVDAALLTDDLVKRVEARVGTFLRGRDRVVSRPEILGGEPVFDGTRISVRFVGERARKGESEKELLEDYPALKPADVEFARMYVALGRPPGRPRKKPRFVRG